MLQIAFLQRRPSRNRARVESLEIRRLLSGVAHLVHNGVTTNYSDSGNYSGVQQAIDAATYGDTIILDAGVVYQSPGFDSYRLTPKGANPNGQWITIQSSAVASLPANQRVGPSQTNLMPTIKSPGGNNVAFTTVYDDQLGPAQYYKLVGLNIENTGPRAGTSDGHLFCLVEIGHNDASQEYAYQAPQHITLDRTIVNNPFSQWNLQHAVTMDGAAVTVTNSYIAGAHTTVPDGNGLNANNGPGPFTIVNNYIEGSSENVIFGGADSRIDNLVMSDIYFANNDCVKPLAWQSMGYNVKNIFELKNARNVMVTGNRFENNWIGGDQPGAAIVFTPVNQGGGAPWTAVQHVNFTNNIIRNSPTGFNITSNGATGNPHDPTQQTHHITISGNLLTGLTNTGVLLSDISGIGIDSLTIDHNTFISSVPNIRTVLDYSSEDGIVHDTNVSIKNNIFPDPEYGLTINQTSNFMSAIGTAFTKNVLIAGATYTGNWNPANVAAVGFTNYAGGNYQLQTSSAYRNAATDGKDVGVWDWNFTPDPQPPVSSGNSSASNLGFESGVMGAWTTWNGGSVVSGGNGHSGTYAGRISTSSPNGGALAQVVTGLTPNTTYTFSGYARTASTSQPVYIGVKSFGGTELSTPISTTSYSHNSVTFTTGPTSTQAEVYFYLPSAGTAHGDDFTLVKSPVVNAGFETGSMGPWTSWNGGSVVNGGNGHSGTYAGRISTTSPSGGALAQVISGLSPNTTYTFSGYARTASASQPVYMGVKSFGGTELSTPISTTSYSYNSVTFTTGASNTSAEVYLYLPTAGTVYGDDFTLVKNLLANPGLESGSLGSWSTGSWNASAVSGGSNPHSGNNAARITSGLNWNSALLQTVTGLTASTTYTFSAWVKTTAQAAYLGVTNHGDAEINTAISSAGYTYVSITFTTGANSTSADLYLYLPNGAGSAYADDFSLIQVA